MVNSYQSSQCDLRSRLEAALSTHPTPPSARPLCSSRPLIAVCFLKENDHYCQNQTISPANDVCPRTTTPLPAAYELNEPTEPRTGSQSKRRDANTSTNTPCRGREGLRKTGIRNFRAPSLYVPITWFLAAKSTVKRDFCLGLHQWKNISRSLAAQTVNRVQERTSMFSSRFPEPHKVRV